MAKKKETNNEPTNNAYFERIKALEKEIESYRSDGTQMGDEILALRRSVSSYKSANTKFKAEIQRLKKSQATPEMERKAVTAEGLEEKVKSLQDELQDLKNRASNELNDKRLIINGLESQVMELKNQLVEEKSYSKTLEGEIAELTKPWWKRIF